MNVTESPLSPVLWHTPIILVLGRQRKQPEVRSQLRLSETKRGSREGGKREKKERTQRGGRERSQEGRGEHTSYQGQKQLTGKVFYYTQINNRKLKTHLEIGKGFLQTQNLTWTNMRLEIVFTQSTLGECTHISCRHSQAFHYGLLSVVLYMIHTTFFIIKLSNLPNLKVIYTSSAIQPNVLLFFS